MDTIWFDLLIFWLGIPTIVFACIRRIAKRSFWLSALSSLTIIGTMFFWAVGFAMLTGAVGAFVVGQNQEFMSQTMDIKTTAAGGTIFFLLVTPILGLAYSLAKFISRQNETSVATRYTKGQTLLVVLYVVCGFFVVYFIQPIRGHLLFITSLLALADLAIALVYKIGSWIKK